MKLEILKENLKSGLSITERIAGKNLSLPVLDNVLMSAENNFLCLTATDLETSVKLWFLANIIKKGAVAVPVRVFSSFVSLLPDEKILLEEKKPSLLVECKNYKTQIQGHNPEDFPIIPQLENLDYIEVDSKKLCQGISQIAEIASPSQARPEISGVFFSFSKNTVKIVATDSFRLAEKTITLESPVKKDISFILPQKPAKEIMNILGEKEGLLKMFVSPNQVLIEFPMKEAQHPQIHIASRLIEGEYPNYQEIIPQKFKTTFIAKRDEFLNQIKTASLFSSKVNEVKLSINPDKKEVGITAQNADVGESFSSFSAKAEGEKIEISFNHKFLTDGLANIKSSEITFEISKEEGACLLRPVGDAGYLYVVMPIKAT